MENPVQPTSTTSPQIGMGERYDVMVTLKSGAFHARSRSRRQIGYCLSSHPDGSGPVDRGGDLPNSTLSHDCREPAGPLESAGGERQPDSVRRSFCPGRWLPYVWTINGEPYDRTKPLPVEFGEMVRLRLTNMSMMAHPCICTDTAFRWAPPGSSGCGERTCSCRRWQPSMWTSSPTTPVGGCCIATTPTMEAGMTRLEYA